MKVISSFMKDIEDKGIKVISYLAKLFYTTFLPQHTQTFQYTMDNYIVISQLECLTPINKIFLY